MTVEMKCVAGGCVCNGSNGSSMRIFDYSVVLLVFLCRTWRFIEAEAMKFPKNHIGKEFFMEKGYFNIGKATEFSKNRIEMMSWVEKWYFYTETATKLSKYRIGMMFFLWEKGYFQ